MPRVKRSPASIARKQVNRLSESIPQVKEGIKAVTVAPTMTAADNLDKARQNYNAAIDSGKTEKALRNVSLSDWQNAALAKADRIAAGAEAAIPKIEKFHGQLQSHQDQIDIVLDKMPNKTLQDGINRMVAQVTGMSKFEYEK